MNATGPALAAIIHTDGATTWVSAWDPNTQGATLTCPGWSCTHCDPTR